MSINKIWNIALATTVTTVLLSTSVVTASHCDYFNSPSTCHQEGCRWSFLIDTCLPTTGKDTFDLALSFLEKFEEEEKEQEAFLFTQLLSESLDEEFDVQDAVVFPPILKGKSPHHGWKNAHEAVLDVLDDEQEDEEDFSMRFSIPNPALRYKKRRAKSGKVAGFEEESMLDLGFNGLKFAGYDGDVLDLPVKGGDKKLAHGVITFPNTNPFRGRISTWDEEVDEESDGPREIKDGVMIFKDTNPFRVKRAHALWEEEDDEEQKKPSRKENLGGPAAIRGKVLIYPDTNPFLTQLV